MVDPGWLDYDETEAAADDCLHAGITVDILRGNLQRAQGQSRYDVQGFHHDGDQKIDHTCTGTDWQYMSNFGYLLLPARKMRDSDLFRRVRLYLDGQVSSAASVRVRGHFTTRRVADLVIDAADGLVGDANYLEFTITATSFGTNSIKNDIARPSEFTESDSSAGVVMRFTGLLLLAKASKAVVLTVRSPRLVEDATV